MLGSYLIDDLAKYAYTYTLIDRSVSDIKVLNVLCSKACTDELIAVNSSVTYNDNSLILIDLLKITDSSYRMNLYGIDSCILDLLGKLSRELNALLSKDLTVCSNYVLCSDMADDTVGKTEFLINLINTYSCKVVLSGVEVKTVQVGTCNLSGSGIAGTNLGIECNESISSCITCILLESGADALLITEHINDLLVCLET